MTPDLKAPRAKIWRPALVLVTVLLVHLSNFLYADINPTAQRSPDVKAQSASGGGTAPSGSADNLLFTGSFLYNVPITVPPGVAGMQPELTLQYNSSQGNSWIGVGWDISLGLIQRSVKNGLPKYNSTDVFVLALKGQTQELSYISDDAAGNHIYREKIDSGDFMKFVMSSNGLQWTVYDKSGTQYIFGATAGARIQPPQGCFAWALEKAVDRNRNAMSITYISNQMQLYPFEILYTSNDTVGGTRAADRKVHFTLASRPDTITTYRGGFKQVTAQRLSAIDTQVLVAGTWTGVKRYTLTYATPVNRVRSELQKIQLSDSNQTISIPLAQIDSLAPTPGWTSTTSLPPLPIHSVILNRVGDDTQSIDYGVRYADLNGDGRLDMLWGMHQDNASDQHWDFAKAFMNTPTGWVDVSLTWRPPVAFSYIYFGNNNAENYARDNGVRIADVNGDGRPDLMVGLRSVTSSTEQVIQSVLINNGAGWSPPPTGQWKLPSGVYFSSFGKFEGENGTEVVDLNGDGLPDIVQGLNVIGGANQFHAWINTGSGWAQNDSWAPPVPMAISNPNLPQKGKSIGAGTRFVDLNGDGLPDLLRSYRDDIANTNTNAIYYNTGTGFLLSTLQAPGVVLAAGAMQQRDRGVQFVDVNGDGLLDWIDATIGEPCNCIGTNFGFKSHVFLNTGSNWIDATAAYPFPIGVAFVGVNANNPYSTFATGALFLDIDGDGQPDLMQSNSYESTVTSAFFLSTTKPELMQTIHNPFGGQTDLQYDGVQHVSGSHQIPFPVEVLTQMQAKDGRGGSITTSYTYDQGLFDFGAKEFLGFGKVKSIDAQGNYAVAYYHQRNDVNGNPVSQNALKGRLYKSEQYDSSGRLLATEETRWGIRNPFTAVTFVRPAWVQNSINNVTPKLTTELDFTFDESLGSPTYGNLLQTLNKGDVALSGDERTDLIEYAQDSNGILLNFPKRSATLASNGTKISETLYLYDGTGDAPLSYGTVAKGNVTQTQRWRNLPVSTYLVTKTNYDAGGLVLNVRDANGNLTSTTYDTFGYPSSVTNALSQTLQSTYDMATGNVLTDTDPNGITTGYQYDALGRLLSVIGPFDSSTYPTSQYDYHSNLLGNPNQQYVEKKVRVVSGTPTTLWSKTYFDGLGRTYKSERQDVTTSVVTETTFNNRGLQDGVSAPRFSTDPTVRWTRTTYDSIGRPTRVDRPDNSSVFTTYTGRSISVQNANGITQSSLNDAHGRVIQRNEPSSPNPINPTLYRYDTLGNLIQLTDSLGKVTTFTYDSLGRKLSLVDPNTGSWSYMYDSNGNLLTQTDARQVVITFQYDGLNRLIKKILTADPGLVTGQSVGTILATYTYDEVDPTLRPYSKGRLTTVTDPASTTKLYHDKVGQLLRQVRTIDGINYQVDTQYDDLGRPIQITYPSQTIKYLYDTAGHLNKITDVSGAVTYASYPTYDAQARVLELDQANGKTRTLSAYDPNTQFLSSLRTESSASGSFQALQSWTYQFDKVGNLLQLNDQLSAAKTQTFTYDNLNRLATATGAYGTQFFTYDSLGNFLRKDNVSYEYAYSTHPYAVSGTGPNSAPAQDASTLLAWNLDPSESIYSVSGTVKNSVGTPLGQIPVLLSGSYEAAIKTGVGSSGNGQYTFRGLAGGNGANYSVQVASVGLSGPGYSYNPLSANKSTQDIVVSVDTNPLNLSQLRIPRTAIGMGGPQFSESSGTYTAGIIGGLGYGGSVCVAGSLSNRSGYSPLGEPGDSVAQPTASVIFSPMALAQNVIGPAFVPGKYKQALSFNGSTDLFVFPNTSALASPALTLMLWAKPNAYPSSGFATLLAKSSGCALGNLPSGFRLVMNTSGKAVFEIGKPGGSIALASAGSLSISKWTFVTTTYDGSAIKIYLDGVLSSTLACTTALINSGLDVATGGSMDDKRRWSPGSFYSGVIDEPRIQNRAWTATEISDVFRTYQGVAGYSYDQNGNRISMITPEQVTSYRYDAQGRLTRVGDTSGSITFAYDADGGRVKKISPAGTTKYIGKLYEERPDGSRVAHVYGNGDLVCDLIQTGPSVSANYYHSDHLGSVSLVTDSNGSLLQQSAYEPFGKLYSETGSSKTHIKYTGQELDSETGLYFYNSRYYDPILGRFISADSVVPSIFDPQSLNRYAYCRNNPVILTDPDGHIFGIDDAVVIAIVVTIAVAEGTHGDVLNPSAYAHFDIAGAGIGVVQTGVYIAALPELGPIGAGALSTMIGTALRGGSPSDIAKSGVIGGISSWAGSQIPVPANELAPVVRITAQTVTGGLTSKLLGGSFNEGATQAFKISIMSEIAIGIANAPANQSPKQVQAKNEEAPVTQSEPVPADNPNPIFLKETDNPSGIL